MRVGDLVRIDDPHYFPKHITKDQTLALVYRRHKGRNNHYWVKWISPPEYRGDVDCLTDRFFEVISEAG